MRPPGRGNDRRPSTIDADTEETNVRALTTKLAAGELDVGLVYRTDARAAGLETIADDTLRQATTAYRGNEPDGAAVLASFRNGAAHAVLLEAGFLDVTT